MFLPCLDKVHVHVFVLFGGEGGGGESSGVGRVPRHLVHHSPRQVLSFKNSVQKHITW